MAPEQAAGRIAEVDALSDIYALGAIAFEMLAGKLPLNIDDMPLPAAVRMIVHEEPDRLSHFDRSLRGDLDTIIGKAMAKDRQRRYASAEALAEDLRRYLESEPISARPPSTIYNLRKFAGRNRALVGGVAASFVILLAGAATSTVFAIRATKQATLAEDRREEAEIATRAEALARKDAESEAMKAKRMVEFLGSMLLGASPRMAEGEDTKLLLRIVAETNQRVDEELAEFPDARAALLQLLSQTYRVMGDNIAARPLIERSVEILLAMPAEELDREQLISARNDLAAVMIESGDAAGAVPLVEANYANSVEHYGKEHLTSAMVGEVLAVARFFAGDIKGALVDMKQATDVRRKLAPKAPETLHAMFQLAVASWENGDTAGSGAIYDELTPIVRRRADAGESHMRMLLADILENHARALMNLDQHETALPLAEEATAAIERAYDADHYRRYLNRILVGTLQNVSGDRAAGEACLRNAVERCRSIQGAEHPRTLSIAHALGVALLKSCAT